MTKETETDARKSIRTHLALAVLGLLALVGGIGGLAASTELSGAVIAPGLVVVDTNLKKVQHPTGGVVGEINVRDGSRVRAGDIVVKLDETVARANLALVAKALDELAARRDRLEAERDATPLLFSPTIVERLIEPDVAALVAAEKRVYASRQDARAGQKSQLTERVAQLLEQIDGLSQQASAKAEEIRLIQEELQGVEQLWSKNLVPIYRVTNLRREETRLRGERGQLISSIAQAKGRISETELQIMQIDQDLRSEVSRELREIQAKSAELAERKTAAEDQLKRIDIRAPQNGVVHQLAVHTIGGVIGAGEAIMLVVPESDELIVEAKISLSDVDQVRQGQAVVLRLSAFNQRTTPELKGSVSLAPADQITDQRSGTQYYVVRVSIPVEERNRLGDLKLLPGMPVEAFFQTGYRTAMSYLTKPLADQMARAFRQE